MAKRAPVNQANSAVNQSEVSSNVPTDLEKNMPTNQPEQMPTDAATNPAEPTPENQPENPADNSEQSAPNPADSKPENAPELPKLTPLGLARLVKARTEFANAGGPKPLDIANTKTFGELCAEYGTSVLESRAKIFGPTVTAAAVRGWMESFANMPKMYRAILGGTNAEGFDGFTGRITEFVDETTGADGKVTQTFRGFAITSADAAAIAELSIEEQIKAISPSFPLDATTGHKEILDWLKNSPLYKTGTKETPLALYGVYNKAARKVHTFFASADAKFDNLYYLVNFGEVSADNFANLPANVQRDFAGILNRPEAAK